MKRIILALTFLLATSSVASAQFTPTKENLRGLPGVRLIVMFHGPTRAAAFDDVKRPGLLKMLEEDTKLKLQGAGIPEFASLLLANPRSELVDDVSKAGNPRLIVLITLDESKGLVRPTVKLMQRVQLVRDPAIELDAVTWSLDGVGNTLETPVIQSLVASLTNQFIRDYRLVNPKESASSAKAAKH